MFIFHGLLHIATSDSGVIKAGNDEGNAVALFRPRLR